MLTRLLTLVCCLILCSHLFGNSTEFYVAPNDNDTNAGSKDAPFATMEKARDEIRKLRESGSGNSFEVILRSGSYLLPDGIRFEARDSDNEGFEKATDFRLQPDSPAFQLGFKPIPVDKIGPYEHKLRASWSIIEAEGVREKPIIAETTIE